MRAFALQKSHDVRFACESKVAPNGDVEVVLAAKNDSTASRRVTVVMTVCHGKVLHGRAGGGTGRKEDGSGSRAGPTYVLFLLTYLRHLVSGHILFHQV